jgi:hypothetical protein
MVDPQPTLVQLLVRHVQLPCELLPQIEINSSVFNEFIEVSSQLDALALFFARLLSGSLLSRHLLRTGRDRHDRWKEVRRALAQALGPLLDWT